MRPDHLEEARDDVDLHLEAVQIPDQLERLGRRLPRERDDHALDVVVQQDLGKLRRGSEDRQVADPLLALASGCHR